MPKSHLAEMGVLFVFLSSLLIFMCGRCILGQKLVAVRCKLGFFNDGNYDVNFLT